MRDYEELVHGTEIPKHCSDCFVNQCKHARYYVDPWPIFGNSPSRPNNCPLVTKTEPPKEDADA